MVWYRLKYELTRDGWLTTRRCENLSVTQWNSTLLATAVERRYLSHDSTRRKLNDLLATYWLGAASSQDQQKQQNGTNLCSSSVGGGGVGGGGRAVIYDADQPLMFDCELAPGKPRLVQSMFSAHPTPFVLLAIDAVALNGVCF